MRMPTLRSAGPVTALAAVLGLAACSSGTPPRSASVAATPTSGVAIPSVSPGDTRGLARVAALRFLDAWAGHRYGELGALVDDQTSDLTKIYTQLAQRLQVDRIEVTPGALDPAGTALPYHATLFLHGLGPLDVDNVVALTTVGGAVRVAFTSSTVFPGLVAGQRVVRTATGRGRLLDRTGVPLAGVDRDLDVNVLGPVGPDGHGTGGLQAALDGRLAGAGAAVQVIDVTTGAVVRTVKQYGSPVGAPDLRTTLDPAIQRAAQAALAGASGPAALVAIDTATGEVRAAANHPFTGFPLAVAGSYAPGSTFKVVTALAALVLGASPDSTVDCPATITAGGKVFRNKEPGTRGRISLREAFAQSCNTAFIGLAQQLPQGSISAMARQLGFNAGGPLPIRSVGGSLPPPVDTAEAAADAIGQGRVEASPLSMAAVAAAAADGTWRQPHLLACPACGSHLLAAGAVAALRSMMRTAVTSGTATALSAVPGGPVFAKTGTAEYGTASPPATHAWMIGFQGGLAFAVYVATGASGGQVAGPLAARFLTQLAHR